MESSNQMEADSHCNDTKNSEEPVAPTTMHSQQQSRLLQLPMELQLAIFEYAVIDDGPLFLNCGCDSSYSCDEAWREDEALWESGEKHPPVQPGLTKTCKLLRAIILPIYYQRNLFRAHYCYAANLITAIQWLNTIGHANRILMSDFALLDMNPAFDRRVPSNIKKAERSEIMKGMGGRMETVARDDCCFHKVVFGKIDGDPFDSMSLLFE